MFLLPLLTLEYPLTLTIYLKLFQKYRIFSLKKLKLFKFFYYIKTAKHPVGGGGWGGGLSAPNDPPPNGHDAAYI